MNVAALLAAIAMVESGNNPTAIGKAGERTEYQITSAVWKKYSKVPFGKIQPWMAKPVALKHVLFIRQELHKQELHNSPFWIAVYWNGGKGACLNSNWVSANVPRRTRDFADRVRAMYHVYEKDPRYIKNNQSK